MMVYEIDKIYTTKHYEYNEYYKNLMYGNHIFKEPEKMKYYISLILNDLKIGNRLIELMEFERIEYQFLFYLIYELEQLSKPEMFYLFCYIYFTIRNRYVLRNKMAWTVYRIHSLFRNIDLSQNPVLKNVAYFLEHPFVSIKRAYK